MRRVIISCIALVFVMGCTGLSQDAFHARAQAGHVRYVTWEQKAKIWDDRWKNFRYNLTDEQIRSLQKAEELQNKSSWEEFKALLSEAQKKEYVGLLEDAGWLTTEIDYLEREWTELKAELDAREARQQQISHAFSGLGRASASAYDDARRERQFRELRDQSYRTIFCNNYGSYSVCN